MIIWRIVVIAVMLLTAACSSERNDDDVKRFFERGPMSGYSPDAGLFKMSQLRGEWDYVATIHGMSDDIDFCEKVADGLRRQFPTEQYSCRLLNH